MLPREGRLTVVELDVRLVQQADVKREAETSGWALLERKARVPTVQVTLQLNRVRAELFGVDVVRRLPRGRPVWRGAERQAERQLLAASLARAQVPERVGLRADAGAGVLYGQREPLAPGHPGPGEGGDREAALTQRAARGLTRGLLDSGRRRGGGRRCPAVAQAQQTSDPSDRGRCDRERRSDTREEGREPRRITPHIAPPEVVREGKVEPREQVGDEGIPQCLRGPAGAVGLFGLLEVVADRRRVDAQQPDLARLAPRGVAGWRLELRFEVLREPEADRLLRVAPHTRVGPGRVDGARECRRNGGARSVEVAHERRNGVSDALQRTHAGEKTENRGRHARREGEPLPLMEPLAARELVADRKR